jgi:tetratricopeptide (TPR) repeat protein
MLGLPAVFLAAVFASAPNPIVAAVPETPPACSREALAADIRSCDEAIAAERDRHLKAHLLLGRAYAFNENYKYDEALKDLDAALAIEPDMPGALHERGYTLGELGDYGRALRDLDREVALRPDSPQAYRERAYARHWSGDFAGAWTDRDREVALQPNGADPLLARADAALWLGRFEDARRDVAAAEALARIAGDGKAAQAAQRARQHISSLSTTGSGGSPAERCHAADKEGKFGRANLIGDCTAAFLAVGDNKTKAELLTIRAIAWLIARQDEVAATDDERTAVALDPGNAKWHMNLGFSYMLAHHSWAAAREFDKALALHEDWLAAAGRAQARLNLGRDDEALADAKKSFEIKPNPVALDVLGQLAHARKDDHAAKVYWMGAYHLGEHGDSLIAELKSIGVDHPDLEPRK